jgi:hypothetical protein
MAANEEGAAMGWEVEFKESPGVPAPGSAGTMLRRGIDIYPRRYTLAGEPSRRSPAHQASK